MPQSKSSVERCFERTGAGLESILRRLERHCGARNLQGLIHSQRLPRLLAQRPLTYHRFLITGAPHIPEKSLSPRELEAVLCLLDGIPRKVVGEKLGVSHFTAETLLDRGFSKLGINFQEESLKAAVTAAAAQPLTMSREVADAFFAEIRTRLDRSLGELLVHLTREIGEPDLGRLFVGRTSPLVLAAFERQGCHYILRGIVEPTLPRLTLREREIAPLLACGLCRGTIAQGLGMTFQTVKAHARSIFSKYDVHSFVELAARLMAEAPRSLNPPPGDERPPGVGPERN